MSQPKLHSLLEAFANTLSGFLVSLAIQVLVIVPIWDLQLNIADNLIITLIFTTASIGRGYMVRRFGNWFHVKTMDLEGR